MQPSTLGHWLKPAGRTTTPRRVAFIVTVGTECPCGASSDTHSVRVLDRVLCAWATRGRKAWSPIQSVCYSEGQAFLDWLEASHWGKSPVYCVAPCASISLTLLQWWDRLDTVGAVFDPPSTGDATIAHGPVAPHVYSCKPPVLNRVPDLVSYRRYGRKYTWVSLPQILPLTVSQLSQLTGFNCSPQIKPAGNSDDDEVSPSDMMNLGIRSMMRLIDWWREIDGGPWGHTVSSLAYHHLLRHLAPKAICTHNDPDSLQLEHAACYGGRAQCWYVGSVGTHYRTGPTGGPAPLTSGMATMAGRSYRVDIRSAYPSILLDRPFPTLRLTTLNRTMPAQVRELTETMGVIVQCTLQTERAEYPSRTSGELAYPVGTFATTLTGPEYARAYDEGSVYGTGRCVLYQRGRPFRPCYTSLLDQRRRAKHTGDSATDTIAKCLANSLTGRLAMRRREWRASDASPPVVGGHTGTTVGGSEDSSGTSERPLRWGDWLDSRPADDNISAAARWGANEGLREPHHTERVISRYRAIAGMVMQYHESEVGEGTLQACYAYLMAYCRLLMRDLRELCPARSVLAQDTDGLWLTEAGYHALLLYPHLWGDVPGKLRLVEEVHHAILYGPQHYWADGEWTLSGLHKPRPTADPMVFEDTYQLSPIAYGATSPPDRVVQVRRRVDLCCLAQKHRTDSSGWVLPLRLPMKRSVPDEVTRREARPIALRTPFSGWQSS